jgi:hypothetical protein
MHVTERIGDILQAIDDLLKASGIARAAADEEGADILLVRALGLETQVTHPETNSPRGDPSVRKMKEVFRKGCEESD